MSKRPLQVIGLSNNEIADLALLAAYNNRSLSNYAMHILRSHLSLMRPQVEHLYKGIEQIRQESREAHKAE